MKLKQKGCINYQEILDDIANIVLDEAADGYNEPRTIRDFNYYQLEALQNLVDKATPKRPLGMSNTHEGRVGNCPNCRKLVGENDPKPEICICGQRLYWNKAIKNR